MVEESINPEFRMKNIEETKTHFMKEIAQNELMSNNYKKVCTTLNYVEYILQLVNNYWMYFSFCICFFAWYAYKIYEFCHRIKKFAQQLQELKSIWQ